MPFTRAYTYIESSNIVMNIFKNNSTRLFGLSTEYPHTVDKEFSIMHGRNNFFIDGHMRPQAVPP